MKNWIEVVKKIRNIIITYPNYPLRQSKEITDFIKDNFKPKKGTKIFNKEC